MNARFESVRELQNIFVHIDRHILFMWPNRMNWSTCAYSSANNFFFFLISNPETANHARSGGWDVENRAILYTWFFCRFWTKEIRLAISWFVGHIMSRDSIIRTKHFWDDLTNSLSFTHWREQQAHQNDGNLGPNLKAVPTWRGEYFKQWSIITSSKHGCEQYCIATNNWTALIFNLLQKPLIIHVVGGFFRCNTCWI